MVLWPQNTLDILYDPETTGMQTSRLKLCICKVFQAILHHFSF